MSKRLGFDPKKQDITERVKKLSQEILQLEADLKEKKKEIKQTKKRSGEEQREQDSTEKLKEDKLRLKSDLKQKKEELKQIKRTGQLDKPRNEKQRIDQVKEAHEEPLRSEQINASGFLVTPALEHKEGDFKRTGQLDKPQNEKQRIDQVVKDHEEPLRSEQITSSGFLVTPALEHKEEDFKRITNCERCIHQEQLHKKDMSEMEAFYKDKLTETRSALKKKEEQLKSLKDKVAQNVVLSPNTALTENMNSPVNQSRLTEMYQQLRVGTWPKTQLTCSDAQARELVQEMFTAASEHMQKVTETVCGGKSSPTVEKFRQTALENLQLALYHSNKQDVFKEAFPSFDAGPDQLRLASECYWLGCLMALNSPPLCPHWEGADRSVFPRKCQSHTRQNK